MRRRRARPMPRVVDAGSAAVCVVVSAVARRASIDQSTASRTRLRLFGVPPARQSRSRRNSVSAPRKTLARAVPTPSTPDACRRNGTTEKDVTMGAHIRTGMLAAGVMAAALCAACEKPVPVAPPPTEVYVTDVVQKDVPTYLELVGQTVGYQDVEIRARVEGFLETMNFQEGTPVRQGALLYTDRKSTRLNSSHLGISYAVFCLKKKTNHEIHVKCHSIRNPRHTRRKKGQNAESDGTPTRQRRTPR